LKGPLTVGLDAALPEAWASALLARLNQTGEAPTANGPQPLRVLDQPSLAASLVTLRPYTQATAPLAERIFAVAAPFATIRDDITLAELTAAWQSGAPVLYTTAETATLLRPILGDFAGTLTTDAELLTTSKARRARWRCCPSTSSTRASKRSPSTAPTCSAISLTC
jgi:hypothetical protein